MARFTGKRRISRKRRSTRKRRVSRNIIYGGEPVELDSYDALNKKLKSLDSTKKKFYKIEIYNPKFPPDPTDIPTFTLSHKDLQEWNYDCDPNGSRTDPKNKKSEIQRNIIVFTRHVDRPTNPGYKIFFTEPTETPSG